MEKCPHDLSQAPLLSAWEDFRVEFLQDDQPGPTERMYAFFGGAFVALLYIEKAIKRKQPVGVVVAELLEEIEAFDLMVERLRKDMMQ